MSFWSSRPVFVTGATGLVGSALVKRLLGEGAFVVALIRDHDPLSPLFRSGLIERVAVVSGALESLETVERALFEFEIETIFHLGAQTIVGTAKKAPLHTFESNIRGSYFLLEAARRALVDQIIVASSDKAYGSSSSLPYTEKMPLEGRNPYDVSKSCTDLLAQSYFHSYGLPVTISRCGNIYGGGDLNWSRLIPGTIRSLLKGERPIIRSNGRFIRDYIYVDDVVDAYLLLAQKGHAGEAYNFAPKRPHTVLEVVASIAKLMGQEELEPMILDQAEGEIPDQYLHCEKAKEHLLWSCRRSFEEGLIETIEWYRTYLSEKIYA